MCLENIKSKDASVEEKIASLRATAAMKAKIKLGMGLWRKKSIKYK